MAQYGDDYLLSARTEGAEKLDQFARTAESATTKVREALKSLGDSGLNALDAKLKISDTTIASYDRLLRTMAQLKAAQEDLVNVQKRYDQGVPGSSAMPYVGNEADKKYAFKNDQQANSALLRATAAVDAANERVAQEYIRGVRKEAADRAATASAVQRAGQRITQARVKVADEVAASAAKEQAAAKKEAEASQKAAEAAQKRAEQSAEQTRLAQVDRNLAYRPVENYPNADLNSKLGRAQAAVDVADTAQKVASLRLAEARNSATRTEDSVISAENAYKTATIRAAAARDTLSHVEARNGSLADQFRLGFRGSNQDRSYAEQIGQAFKFSVFYGTAYKLLFGITQTLQATLQEGIQFEQAMTELSVAAGRPKDQLTNLATTLGQNAAQAGFAPSQGVLVGARSLGLFGLTGRDASLSDQASAAEISSRVISRIAMGSGLQPADIQSNIGAIANAYNAGPEGQIRAYDLDAYLTRKFGVAPGQTLAPVSEAATVGQAAGFSQEQVTAIAADLIARTGTSPEAVAGYMAQIFSRSGEGALNAVNARYGVDNNQPLAQQFAQLAKVYARNPDSRDEISAAFGRGKVQNAVIALLQDYGDVQHLSQKAGTAALGEGDKQFGLRMQNLGGQLAKLVGVLREFASALGQSGLLTDLGVLVVAFRDLVEVATSILRTWDKLPDVAKATAVALITLAGAAKLASAEGILGGGGGAHRAEGSGLFGLNKGFALGALVLGDAFLWGQLHDSVKNFTDAQNNAAKTLAKDLGPNATPAQLQAHAAGLHDAASQERDQTTGLLHRIGILGSKYSLGGTDAAARTQADSLDAEAKRLEALAKYKQAAEANANPSQALVSGFDSESLTTSMQAITDSGGTARERLDALNATLRGTADAAHRLDAAFDPHLFAGDNARGLLSAIQGSSYVGHRTGSINFNPITSFKHPISHSPYTNAYDDAVAKVLSSGEVAGRTQQALSGIGSVNDIKGSTATSIARYIVGDTPEKALASLPDPITDTKDINKARAQAIAAVRKKLLAEAKAMKELMDPKHRLSSTELTAVVNEYVTEAQNLADSLPQNDFSGRIKAAQGLVRQIIGAINRSKDGATPGATQALDNARHAVAQAQISRLEALRVAAQHMAKTDKEVKNIGRGFFNRELARAIQGGNSDDLVGLINNAGDWSIAIAKKAINDAIKVIRASISTEAQVQAFQASEIAGIRGMIGQVPKTGGGPTSEQQHRLDQLNGLLQSLTTALPAGKDNVYDTGSDANRPDKPAAKTPGPTAAQIAAARAQAFATESESPIQQARAAIQSARADMAAAKKGTVDYYNALQAYFDARNQLTDAILEYRNNQYLLGHDITNPLVQARAQLVAAQRKLASDRGKPADVRAADKVAVRQAHADVEAQAFQQRLDAVQTAEQLGRMSYSAYINYLNHERDRLKHIAHRSYQQQQELNQVDELLKTAADQMQGQWNFGDIKLPTPYQVRRYIEEHSGNGGSGAAGVTNDGPRGGVNHYHVTRIVIDGADTGAVLRVVREYLRGAARNSTNGTRYR